MPAFAAATPGLPLQDDVELLIAAVAPGQGVQATDRARVRLPLGVVSQAGLVSPRYRLCARVSVAPGHYQVRLGVRSTLAGKTGSVYADVSVPDFFRQPLSLSGLFLERRGTFRRLPTVATKGFSSLVPFDAALDRDFEPDDELWARVRAYRGKGAARGAVLVTTTVSSVDDGAVVWRASESKPADAFGAGNEAEYGVRIPVDTLGPGAYRLRVTAETAGQPPDAREADFSVHVGTEAASFPFSVFR